MEKKVVVILGSKSDLDFGNRIANHLKEFGIDYEIKIASAHRSTKELLQLLEQYKDIKIPFITVAGRLDALSGVVAANTLNPVIACPPDTDDWNKLSEARKIEIWCSLDVPSTASFALAIGSEMAALLAAKILALSYKELAEKIKKNNSEIKC